jgi:molybdopterin synthase catalytic subunit
VVGADPDLQAVASRLDGRTATVVRGSVDSPTETDATVRLGSDGSRTTRAVDEFPSVLDRLAPDYDYALVAGVSRLRLPTVVVDDHDGTDDADATGDHDTTGDPDATGDHDATDDADATGDHDATDDADATGDVIERLPSGDAVTPERLATLVRDVEPYVTLSSLVAEAKSTAGAERSGAIATFTGRVRARDDPGDDPTTQLAFERYDTVAADRLATIESELTDREGVFGVWTHHRTGVIPAGEDIVFVVVLAGHREEAFTTVSDGIDRLKREVPIFKKETTVSEAFWTHERE